MSLCCEYRAGRQGSGCRGRRTAFCLVPGRNAGRRIVFVRQTVGVFCFGIFPATATEAANRLTQSGAHELDDFFRHKHHFPARTEVKTAERNGGGRTFRRPFAVFLRLKQFVDRTSQQRCHLFKTGKARGYQSSLNARQRVRADAEPLGEFGLVPAHEASLCGNVGSDNGCKPLFFLFGHTVLLS